MLFWIPLLNFMSSACLRSGFDTEEETYKQGLSLDEICRQWRMLKDRVLAIEMATGEEVGGALEQCSSRVRLATSTDGKADSSENEAVVARRVLKVFESERRLLRREITRLYEKSGGDSFPVDMDVSSSSSVRGFNNPFLQNFLLRLRYEAYRGMEPLFLTLLTARVRVMEDDSVPEGLISLHSSCSRAALSLSGTERTFLLMITGQYLGVGIELLMRLLKVNREGIEVMMQSVNRILSTCNARIYLRNGVVIIGPASEDEPLFVILNALSRLAFWRQRETFEGLASSEVGSGVGMGNREVGEILASSEVGGGVDMGNKEVGNVLANGGAEGVDGRENVLASSEAEGVDGGEEVLVSGRAEGIGGMERGPVVKEESSEKMLGVVSGAGLVSDDKTVVASVAEAGVSAVETAEAGSLEEYITSMRSRIGPPEEFYSLCLAMAKNGDSGGRGIFLNVLEGSCGVTLDSEFLTGLRCTLRGLGIRLLIINRGKKFPNLAIRFGTNNTERRIRELALQLLKNDPRALDNSRIGRVRRKEGDCCPARGSGEPPPGLAESGNVLSRLEEIVASLNLSGSQHYVVYAPAGKNYRGLDGYEVCLFPKYHGDYVALGKALNLASGEVLVVHRGRLSKVSRNCLRPVAIHEGEDIVGRRGKKR